VRPERPKEEQILVWCGVVAQLVRTRANRGLADAEIPYPLFVLLRHFCHDPAREWTVTQLARAFETAQPGMTKKVQALVERGLLTSRIDERDARVRWVRVTRRGERLRDRLMALLEPDQTQFFRGWKAKEVAALHQGLERLKTHLDDHRDEVILPE
jgi:DNA-binding MarR family transcriptional regulator